MYQRKQAVFIETFRPFPSTDTYFKKYLRVPTFLLTQNVWEVKIEGKYYRLHAEDNLILNDQGEVTGTIFNDNGDESALVYRIPSYDRELTAAKRCEQVAEESGRAPLYTRCLRRIDGSISESDCYSEEMKQLEEKHFPDYWHVPAQSPVDAAHLDFEESSDDEPEIPYEVACGGGPYAEDYTDVVDYHSDMLDRVESVAEYNATLSHVHAVARDATSQPDIADIVSDSDRFMKLFHSSTYGKYPRPVPIKVRRVDWDGGYFDTAYCFETLEEATTWGDALLGPRDQGYMRYYVMDGDNNTLHVGIYTPAQVPPVPPVPSLEEDDVPYHVTYSNGPTHAHEHDTIPLHDADTGLELTGLDPIWHDDWGYGEVTVNGVRTLYTIETGGMDNYNPFEYGYINLDWLKRKPQPAQVDTRSFIHPEHDVPPFTVTLTDWEDQETSETFLDYPMAFKYADTIMDAYHFHYCRITNAQGYECYAHYFTEQDPF
jgi:hypothetical protein